MKRRGRKTKKISAKKTTVPAFTPEESRIANALQNYVFGVPHLDWRARLSVQMVQLHDGLAFGYKVIDLGTTPHTKVGYFTTKPTKFEDVRTFEVDATQGDWVSALLGSMLDADIIVGVDMVRESIIDDKEGKHGKLSVWRWTL